MNVHRRPLAFGAALIVPLALTACSDPFLLDPGAADLPRPSLSEQVAGLTLGLDAMEHVLVLHSQSAPTPDLLHAIESAGGSVVARHDRIGVLVVRGLGDADAESLVNRGDVEASSRDRMIQWQPAIEALRIDDATVGPASSPADAAFYDLQWNMRQIAADQAWDTTPRGSGALVCILDSGIDPNHVDIAGKVDFGRSASFVPELDIPGIPELSGQFDIFDYFFHGTFVASQVATNGLGMASVAPDANLCIVKVLNALGSGPFAALISGILHAADVRADVINMSLGAYFDLKDANPEFRALLVALQRAILFANARGSLVVAAAGNEGADLDNDGTMISVPSQMLGVVRVSATGPTNQADFDRLASYSNFGRTGVTVAAPGGDLGAAGNSFDGVLGACSSLQLALPFACGTGSFILSDGTSVAAPHVSGLAAVVESAVKTNAHGVLLAACAIRGAERIDGHVFSPLYGFGRINVHESVRRFGCGGPTNLFARR